MANKVQSPEDALTKKEIEGTATAGKPAAAKNAFSELMSPKRKASSDFLTTSAPHKKHPSTIPHDAASNAVHGRNALLEYITSPSSFPATRVVSYDEDFVVINDLYPKSTMHLLILPRDPAKYLLHPFEAFADAAFLASVRSALAEVVPLAASELRRKYSKFSATDAARNAALDAEPAPDDLPQGRDWKAEIITGVHAHPSMTHLHIHIISRDRVSECMRHKKHYNSFATPFLVPMDAFPLAKDDVRRHPGREGYLDSSLKCWRCEKDFGRKFKDLKAHLGEELETWKRL